MEKSENFKNCSLITKEKKMNKKILETLEFNKVKALFEPHLLTEQGLEQLKELVPSDKGDKIKQAFEEMEEMQEWKR